MHKLLLVAAVSLAALPAQAAIVIDKSIDALGTLPTFNASNRATNQNFLVRFTLDSATTLTGAAIYSNFPTALETSLLGNAVVLKFRNDVDGGPDVSNFATFNSTISVEDNGGSTSAPNSKQLYASFAPLALAAGTYWFGLSGVNEIGIDLRFGTPGGTPFVQLGNDTVSNSGNLQGGSTLYYRLYDGAPLGGAIPEPASWAMLIAGLGLTGATLRRRRQTAAAVGA